jgi:hypothetical protein
VGLVGLVRANIHNHAWFTADDGGKSDACMLSELAG